MNHNFLGWDDVATCLTNEADHHDSSSDKDEWLNIGQRACLNSIASRLTKSGVIIADEVGMGKTRIAVATAKCVVKSGGRVAIVVPPGLGYQWDEELRDGGISNVPAMLRSLWSYLSAWKSKDSSKHEPWFSNQIVVISHAFTNWRLSTNSNYWRRSLLPEIYARWRKKCSGRFPRYYCDNKLLSDTWVSNAGKSIVDAIPLTGNHPGRAFLQELLHQFQWNGTLNGDYGQGTNFRKWLESSVGLGLGVFDLIIIDEAHKSRGSDSGLSRLLSNVLFESKDARRLCMTATPVELNVTQWENTLSRIKLNKVRLEPISKTILSYSKTARKVRQCWRSGGEVCEEYRIAAESFRVALAPYVLRRDKREDHSVQLFQTCSGLPISKYRNERNITIEIDSLSPKWQQAVCAAEALSFVTKLSQDPVAKRLRLTLGNGHGIAALLDHVNFDKEKDEKQTQYDEEGAEEQALHNQRKSPETASDKRAARAKWWLAAITHAFAEGDGALYSHPAIMAATTAIEQATAEGEKVLVFGRFTRPMRALTDLLNARAMLTALERDEPWPQRKVHGGRFESSDKSEWPAVRAAHSQLREMLGLTQLNEDELNSNLRRQYSRFDSSRDRFRSTLIEKLRYGFAELRLNENDKCLKSFEAFSWSVKSSYDQDLQIVSRALLELLASHDGVDTGELQPRNLAAAFCALVKSASDRDDPDVDEDGDGIIDRNEANNMWVTLRARIKEEYGRTRGSFARFMYGNTAQSSRRMIQLAFNRPGSFPRVLVAQSMVGREGLNLHKACRIVVMLHPEWNPGVTEQQIGRVDRVGSHWCKQLDRAIADGTSVDLLPRIEVRPVIFCGTYDEHNWNVLRERWDDLRAQLHGIVVPDRHAEQDEESRRIIDLIASYAPNFSPLRENTFSPQS